MGLKANRSYGDGMSTDAALKLLGRFVGSWVTEATHSAMPGVVVHGTAVFEWLEGERFLIQRARTDHPDFPDSIAIIGFTDQDRVGEVTEREPELTMHYFDSRGVFRVYAASVDDAALGFSRAAPGFSQRFRGTFDASGALVGVWQLSRDDVHWDDDLAITYRRAG